MKNKARALSSEEKSDIDVFIQEYYNSDMTLADIFHANPHEYHGVSLGDIGLSARVISALKLCGRSYILYEDEGFKVNNLFDLLRCSVFDLFRIRNIGKVGFAEIVVNVKKFVEENKKISAEELTLRQMQKLLGMICSGDKTISDIIYMLEDESRI